MEMAKINFIFLFFSAPNIKVNFFWPKSYEFVEFIYLASLEHIKPARDYLKYTERQT